MMRAALNFSLQSGHEKAANTAVYPGYENLKSVLANFKSIGLEEMGQASLMRRIDSKYWFNVSQLPQILSEVSGFYNVLKIRGLPVQAYGTHYFDTPLDTFYHDHHNGRGKRFKIRKREYIGSGLCFLEVKRKNQKGATTKRRIPVQWVRSDLNPVETSFLEKELQQSSADLAETIRNQFSRITLVNRNLRERCTIDFGIEFSQGLRRANLRHIAIIELKQMSRDTFSPLQSALWRRRFKPSGFSKYCIGRALLQPELKQNRFKPVLMKLNKQNQN